ncbi:Rid family hydrolase [Plebeiibacterium sediminum]|uniref:Rid family hydrolase n=1 Tax=Plebeiibacterium sediminum TaxID=2992112 RepID=A0AAE3SDK4_9BACT|nr:Rid family hydrolase [Plebeiobacterium sediminum]MCW3785325.1 Rid family hydrolase [Plebeiobacterium sediminum]
MNFEKFRTETAEVSISKFEGKLSEEYNLFITPSKSESVEEQLNAIRNALTAFLNKENYTSEHIAFQRLFVSDFTNQSVELDKTDLFNCDCALSIVQQSPLNGKKVGLWTCIYKDKSSNSFHKKKEGNKLVIDHNGYSHIYTTQMHSTDAETCSYNQTNNIFNDYLRILDGHNLTLEEHCIRTWFYVRDIDNNYAGLVKARNEVFDQFQMTKDTHFITSTGIEGRYAAPSVSVLLDAYAIGGIKPEQIRFLEAREFLNPTHEYGVAFERGTAVEYGDRRQIFISGTASIDNRGEIVHVGDINGQIRRTFQNISALLGEANAEMNDISSMIVYLRDVADYATVEAYLQEKYAHLPYIIVLAPVCRPGWLIEIECIAVKEISNSAYNCF